jgi:hypothetical protein
MYVLYIVVCAFVIFLSAIVLSVLLRFTDSDYHFGIFKLFLALIYVLYVIVTSYIRRIFVIFYNFSFVCSAL